MLLCICHDCDLLLQQQLHSVKSSCPRCGGTIHNSSNSNLRLPFVLALSGLILMLPAYNLPLISLTLFGQHNDSTMLNGIFLLFQTGHWWIASLILFCSVIAPLIILLLIVIIVLLHRAQAHKSILAPWLNLYQFCCHWVMLDVYIVSIIVSFIKLSSYGPVNLGLGLVSYTLLMLVSTATISNFHIGIIWHRFTNPVTSDTLTLSDN